MFIGKTKIILFLFLSFFLNSLRSHPNSGIDYTKAERVSFEKNK